MDIRPLKNIFAPEEIRTAYCTVLRRLSASRYEVQDNVGRTLFVDGTGFYPPGVRVMIRDGVISGTGNALGKNRNYDV